MTFNPVGTSRPLVVSNRSRKVGLAFALAEGDGGFNLRSGADALGDEEAGAEQRDPLGGGCRVS